MPRVPIPAKKGKPFQYPTIRVINPGKGLNSLVSAELIDDHEASDLNNVVFTEAGSVTKGPGVTVWAAATATLPSGLGTFIPQGGTRQVVISDGGLIKYSTTANDTWHAAGGASLTAGHEVTFTQLRSTLNASTGKDVLYAWNGFDGGAYFDGATLTRPGTMPSAGYSILYNGLHIAAGTPTNTSRLYIADTNTAGVTLSGTFKAATGSQFTFVNSSFNVGSTATLPPQPIDPIDVPGTTVAGAAGSNPNIVDINPGDGDKITGLSKFQGALIVFKEHSIWQLTFDPSSGLPIIQQINNYMGAVNHKSIDNVENDVFYLSRLGWFTLGYQSGYYTIIRTNELSVRIHPLIDAINPTNLPLVASLYKPYRFYSSVPYGGSAHNNLTVVYDKRYDAWSKLDYVNASAFTVFTDSTLTQHLLYADSTANRVWEITDSTYSNNGSPIDAYWQSKAFDGGQPELYKRWIDLTLYFRRISGTVTITVYTDDGSVAHTSSVGGAQYNGGIAATGMIGTEMLGGNSTTDTNGDPTPANTLAGTSSVMNIPYRIRLSATSRTIMVKVEEATDTLSTFVLLGLALTYRPYSHFKFPSSLKIQ